MATFGKAQAHAEPMLVSRRVIYLHRLVGDNVITPTAKIQRRAPWRTIIFFIAYVGLSADWMVKEVMSNYILSVNDALEVKIKGTPWKVENGAKSYFSNITTPTDIPAFLLFGLLPDFISASRYSEPTSFLTYNRPLPNEDLCDNVSSFYITMRVVKTKPSEDDPSYTTGKRFKAFYPTVWSSPSVESGSPETDNELKEDLYGMYPFPGHDNVITLPPESMMGTTKQGVALTHGGLSKGEEVHVTWKHQHALESEDGCTYCHGLKQQGGYVAMLSLKMEKEHQAAAQRARDSGDLEYTKIIQDIIYDQMVFLLDDAGTQYTNGSFGVCGMVRTSNIIRMGDWMHYVEDLTGRGMHIASLAVNFQLYNANMQTLTAVTLTWNINAAGIVYSSDSDFQTIYLDPVYHVIQFLVFALVTAYYFLELFIYRCYKNYTLHIWSPWIYVDMISIIFCLAAMSVRVSYGSNIEAFLAQTANRLPRVQEIMDFVNESGNFQAVAAIACVSLCARMVEVLSKTPFRVHVLERTLRNSGYAVIKYTIYMLTVMLSFVAFATLHFSEFSEDFRDPWHALVSCVSMLFISTRPYDGVRQAFWSLPFLFVYFMFAIISVQMFNAIINYSYNRTCEDMEPEYYKQLREKKMRESQMGPRRSVWKEALMKCLKYVRKACCPKKQGDKEEGNDEAADKKNKGKTAAEDDLTPAERDQAERALESIEKKPQGETFYGVFLFTVFVISYNVFLFDNLDIRTNGNIIKAIRQTVYDAKVEATHPSGVAYGRYYKDVSTIYDVATWMTHALPEAIKGDAGEYSGAEVFADFYDESAHCIKSWNCIVQLPENETSPRKQMVRITQRLQKRVQNQGVSKMIVDSPPTHGFRGGPALLPLRGPPEYFSPDQKPNTEFEDTSKEMDLSMNGHTFCKREQSGGYHNKGGIVCLLDANLQNMSRQLLIMLDNGFYSLNTSAIIVEFAIYNGNSNNMAYTRITFELHPNGMIEKEIFVVSLSLVKMHWFGSGMGLPEKFVQVIKTAFQPRLIWGIVYTVFLFIMISIMFYEVVTEVQTERSDTYYGAMMAFLQYFTQDVYHKLDCVSFAISITSIIVFIVWLWEQGRFMGKSESFSDFVTYAGLICNIGRMYANLSAFNVLLITWRFLKYLRVVPRVNQINDTLSKAMPDIMWFTCMLIMFFMGFVLFAHINFGSRLKSMSTVEDSLMYCFKYLIGDFFFWDLWHMSPILAICFFFPYLFLFNLFFLNVFFAIMDKNFVNKEVQTFTVKTALKPIFGRCVRFINWDDDLNMEEDPSVKKVTNRPDTRADRVKKVADEIREILDSGIEAAGGGVSRKAKALGDVLEKDERIEEVIRWTRDEAKRFVATYRNLLQDKEDAINDESFINKKVKVRIEKELEETKEAMEDAERLKKYAIHVHELMAMHDQETLARYICCLEAKIMSVTTTKRIVLADFYHLTAEAEKMRYTDEELWRIDNGHMQVAEEDQQLAPNAKGTHAVSLPSVPPEADNEIAIQDVLIETADQQISSEQVQAEEQAAELGAAESDAAVKLRTTARVTAQDLNKKLSEFIDE